MISEPGAAMLDSKLFVSRQDGAFRDLYERWWDGDGSGLGGSRPPWWCRRHRRSGRRDAGFETVRFRSGWQPVGAYLEFR